MISKAEYIGTYNKCSDLTPVILANIDKLLTTVNKFIQAAQKDGVIPMINPATKSQVGGELNGGFRPQSCTIGAPMSAHKLGMACDIYDPTGAYDKWANDPKNLKFIQDNGMYFEASKFTIGWCHISTKSPASGRRFFIP
jgi:hypothetical protein